MKILTNSIVLIVFVLFASTASASLIYGDYGYVDEIFAAANLANSGTAEIDFISNTLGISDAELILSKDEDLFGNWFSLDTDVFAYDFEDYGPSWFLIKTGQGVTYGDANIEFKEYDTYLYRNLESFQYAVVDLGVFGGINTTDVTKISHLTAPVPEPSTIILLGVGLVSLALYRRKKSI